MNQQKVHSLVPTSQVETTATLFFYQLDSPERG